MSNQAFTDDQFPRKFGNYQLLAPLAQGGMGALYLAVRGDRGFERLLVIKTVLPHLADSEYIARFRDEAKVVVKLSHGNLIPVFDAGAVDGELFLAMDFVEGRDLRAVWNRCAKKQVAFPIDVAVYIIKELCRGLAYAHSFGGLKLVHRDVSPPNILISFSGEVKVTDFGLASSTLKLEKTAPGIIYGKVAYMSPEQARGEPLDGRSDLYAAAIVLWELLTGRQLFPPGKDQPHDLLQRAKNPMPMAPSKRAPRVPPDLDDIVLRGLTPGRDERYADGEEFRQALADWLRKEAPGTDAARIEAFLQDLFGEDIERERAEREALLAKMRERMQTLPPSEELQRALAAEQGDIDGKLMRTRGSTGRRAEDRGEDAVDRRQAGDRRRAGSPDGTEAEGAHADERPHDGRAAIGLIIDGRYRILDLIGEGGMGRVYLAEHVEIGRRVAIKILHPVYSRMPDLVERFRREARAASKIGNPHIVDVTDSGRTKDGAAYFVMEHLDGEELSSVIDREGAIDITRALRIGIQICQALAAAHAAGIIHRDLKPENVFLTSQQGAADFVKILDFGVATSTESDPVRAKRLTTPGMAMGTPEYMSPEQAAGRLADERCDVYSVGAILYEAITGAAPYQGDNFMEVLTKKATVDPEPAKNLRPELPEEIGDLVARIMARKPEDRPASMEVLEYELTKCVEGRATAVAKVLGMNTDPGLVNEFTPAATPREELRRPPSQADGMSASRPGLATSSPGVSASRPGMSASRPGLATSSPAVETPPPARPAGARSPGAAEDPFEMDVVESTEMVSRPVKVRSRWIVLGLVGVVLILALGVGAVLMVASDDLNKEPSGTLIAAAGPIDAAPEARPAEVPDARVERPAPPVDAAPARPSDPPDAGKPANGKPEKSGVPETQAEAKALLAKADELAGKGQYGRARKLYGDIAKSEFLAKEANLGLASIAFETGDQDGIITYATKALRAGGGTQARLLLGRAFFKKGRYEDALRYYEAVLKSDPGHKEAGAAAKKARELLQR